MTPDLVAELLRQLMKEAMILSAPVLLAAVLTRLYSHALPNLDESSGAVVDCRFRVWEWWRSSCLSACRGFSAGWRPTLCC